MIMYNFSNKPNYCFFNGKVKTDYKLDWNDFLCIKTRYFYRYKNSFKDFGDLYEYIEKNKSDIICIRQDGLDLYLKNGQLHNLNGAAVFKYKKYDKNDYYPADKAIKQYYINGKLVYFMKKPCDTDMNFNNGNLEFYEYVDIYNRKGRIKKGIDYNIHEIDISTLKKEEERIRKLGTII